jgi:hypothetical protein
LLSTCSVNALSCAIVTTYKSLSCILVSPLDPKPEVVAAVDSVVTGALGGIMLTCRSSLL